ncbi:hypothetical protein BST12_10950 [Mycobacterium angelicum]|uniref:Uncharacterized protein n=1 Tax=Mycobacterium angelicum TaxID=470074 RepID=A0A1W9ZVY9_MYCAN|nr:hypothetical protein BST12_10950 [Mycobacterium angelicum]
MTLAMMAGCYVLVRTGRQCRRADGDAVPRAAGRPGAAPGGESVGSISRQRPDQPPAGFPVWPLWHTKLARLPRRQAGALSIAARPSAPRCQCDDFAGCADS